MALQRDSFSVATFNVLARSYSNPGFMPWVPVDVLDWRSRSARLAEVYASVDASILCLQEVDEFDTFHREALQRLGYETAFAQRTGAKLDGLVTAHRSAEFEALSTEVVEFDDLCKASVYLQATQGRSSAPPSSSSAPLSPSPSSSSSPASRLKTGNVDAAIAAASGSMAPVIGSSSHNPDRLRRGNIATISLFRHRSSGRRLLVANTHIFWNPRHEDVKLAQCQFLLMRIEETLQRQVDGEVATIITGDFNSLPTSDVYSFLARGKCRPHTFVTPTASLLLDNDGTHKLAHFLRTIGVDTATADQQDSADDIFRQCASENRVFVTRSTSKVKRSACPPFVLLVCRDADQNFRDLVSSFQFKLDPAMVYNRCVGCNGMFEKVPPERYATMATVPLKLRGGYDRAGNALEFVECIDCEGVYWWGNQTNEGLDRIIRMLRGVVDTTALDALLASRVHLDVPLQRAFPSSAADAGSGDHCDESHAVTCQKKLGFRALEALELAAESNAVAQAEVPSANFTADAVAAKTTSIVESQLPALSASASDRDQSAGAVEDALANLSLSHTTAASSAEPCDGSEWRPLEVSHSLRLASASVLAHGTEPAATNITSKFVGTLDYVFLTPSALSVDRVVRCN